MFVKATRVTSGGRQLTYLQLVESYRDGGRVRQRVIAKLGREDELDPGAIERLVRSLAKYADVEVGAGNVLDEVELLPGLAFGWVFRRKAATDSGSSSILVEWGAPGWPLLAREASL
jgi:hypothetical protein